MDPVDWKRYLRDFHEEHPGITEDVLGHAQAGGVTPYQWLLEAVPDRGLVLDLACGSAPLAPSLTAQGWVGIDSALGELEAGDQRGQVVVANGTVLPVAGTSTQTVVCSMALMLLQPLEAALEEVVRVLRPGGSLVALLPSTRPLTPLDALRYARLMAALRHRWVGYPNDEALGDAARVLARAGLRLVSDERRRFECSITSPTVGVMCVRSLYLPGVPAERVAAGEGVASGWVGKKLGLPLRRLVAVSAGQPPP